MSEDFCQDVSSTKLTVNDVVLVGGSPGSGRNEYLREVLQLAKSKRKQAVFHHVYDYMVEAGKERTPPVTIDKRTVLNLHSSVLTAIQDAAFAKIASKIRNRNCPHFVSTPLRFSWQGKVITGVEAKTVKLLKPTKFVVIIDDVAATQDTLKRDPQWKRELPTLEVLSNWRQEEMKAAQDLSEIAGVKQRPYVIARDQQAWVLYDLVYNSKKSQVYFSFPITGRTETERRQAQDFSDKLTSKFVVFNPLTIYDNDLATLWKTRNDQMERKPRKTEIPEWIQLKVTYKKRGTKIFRLRSAEVRTAIASVRDQIVTRDFDLIDQARAVVVYHNGPQISVGVVCEMMYAHFQGYPVYAYYPYEPSPFFDFMCTERFGTENELMQFLLREL